MSTESFHECFKSETFPDDARVSPNPPPIPTDTLVTNDSIANYLTLENNPNFGCTGIMSVVPFHLNCYGDVAPGTVFLFPGTFANPVPAYNGDLTMNCQGNLAPLGATRRVRPTLHKQLVDLITGKSKEFIGFSVLYPWYQQDGIGYNSFTCNKWWFNSNTLPLDWQVLVRNTIDAYLPGPPAQD